MTAPSGRCLAPPTLSLSRPLSQRRVPPSRNSFPKLRRVDATVLPDAPRASRLAATIVRRPSPGHLREARLPPSASPGVGNRADRRLTRRVGADIVGSRYDSDPTQPRGCDRALLGGWSRPLEFHPPLSRERRSSDAQPNVVRGSTRNPEPPFAFEMSMISEVLQFTLTLAADCEFHRRTSRVIHHQELFYPLNYERRQGFRLFARCTEMDGGRTERGGIRRSLPPIAPTAGQPMLAGRDASRCSVRWRGRAGPPSSASRRRPTGDEAWRPGPGFPPRRDDRTRPEVSLRTNQRIGALPKRSRAPGFEPFEAHSVYFPSLFFLIGDETRVALPGERR